MGTWNAYGNEYWPADYLIDAHGQVRYATFGEGDYDKTETAIRALLAEAGAPGRRQEPPDRRDRAHRRSHARDLPRHRPRAGLGQRARSSGDARLRRQPPTGELGSTTSPTAAPGTSPASPPKPSPTPGSTLEFEAKHVYLVLSSPANVPLPVQVLLDGRRSPPRTPAPTSTTAWSRCAASACTRSCRCRATNSTA